MTDGHPVLSTKSAVDRIKQRIRNFITDAVFTDTANAEMQKEGYRGRSLDGFELNKLLDEFEQVVQKSRGALAGPESPGGVEPRSGATVLSGPESAAEHLRNVQQLLASAEQVAWTNRGNADGSQEPYWSFIPTDHVNAIRRRVAAALAAIEAGGR